MVEPAGEERKNGAKMRTENAIIDSDQEGTLTQLISFRWQ